MDFLRDGLVFAVVALLVAWLGPTDTGPRLRAAASRFEQPVASVQGHFTRLFAAVGYGGRGGAGGFGPTMALSGAISLNDAPIFEARVEAEPYRLRYWRMAVYDTYTGSSWQRTGEVRHGQAAGDLLDGPEFAARVPVTQTVTVLQNGTRQLYAAPQPVSFGLPTRINALRYSDEGLDVSSVESLARLNVDDEYEVVSVVSVADVANLEAAGTAYPDWIRDKYMQLPDSLPRSIRDQALKIVGRETNPYRKAAAIERWLRENMTYDERIPTPPRNRDAVDWFLFTQRAGYCDYYASAFVILTRAVGVPVRLAAGYSSGQPIGNAPGTYRQAAADAHSWPEVYFPRYGWIEFEPTAGDQPLVREEFGGPRPEESLRAVQDERQEMLPEDEMRELDRRTSAQAESGPPSEERNQPALPFALLVVSVSASVALAAVARWQWNRSLTGMSLVESAYARMSRFAAWMGVHLAAHQTPYEYARRIVERVPRGEPEIGLITEAYVRERFARCEAVGDSNALLVAWSRLRARLARGVLIHAVAAGAGRARRLLGRPGRRRRP
jgi:transglutaminase-like putative cysteine protease